MLIGDEYILCDKVGKSYEDKKKKKQNKNQKKGRQHFEINRFFFHTAL